jgi:pyruvate dehydrogenase E2 component (dihydrolipoamide acetyltransferase)
MSRIAALTVPRWGMAMEEGTLVNWLAQEGQALREGDDVAELESSKIVNVLQTHASGVLRRRLVSEGETLPVGALLGVLAAPEVQESEIDRFIAAFKPVVPPAAESELPSPEPQDAGEVRDASAHCGATNIPETLKQGPDDSGVPATPHARRFARKLGVNLNNVKGAGRGGRVQIEDIEQAIVATGGSLPAKESPVRPGAVRADAGNEVVSTTELAGMRLTIARRLKEAKRDAPHYRLVIDVNADALMGWRQRLNAAAPGPGVSANDLLVLCCARALTEVPECNVQFVEGTVRQMKNADVSIAVAVEGGLITPVVRAANLLTPAEIAVQTRALIEKARAGRLTAPDYEGGTFTISNLGMYGVRQFDGIINPPQVMILAVGRIEKRVVVRDDEPAVARQMTLTLSCDHRIIDGALGARFLKALARHIEHPENE